MTEVNAIRKRRKPQERVRYGHRKLNGEKKRYSAWLQRAYRVILSSHLIGNFPKHASFWSHALMVSFGGERQEIEEEEWRITSKEREKMNERFGMTCNLTCREPQWRPGRGSHGLWWLKRCRWGTGHLNREGLISVGISLPLIGSVCSDKTTDTTPSLKTHQPTHSNTHQGLPSHLLPPIQPWWKAKRGSSVLADQTNTAAAFRPGRQGGCAAQRERTGDWLKNDNRYSTAAQRSHFLFSFSFFLPSLPH